MVKRSYTEDLEKRKILGQYLRGWAMGLEFGEHNPRAATDIVFKSLPIVKSNLGADLGTESMLQLANVFRGNMDEREGWGYHDWGSWKAYFKTIRSIGQLKRDVNVSKVINNDFISSANDFDANKVKADAKGYKLSADLAKVNIDKIKGRFYANVVK